MIEENLEKNKRIYKVDDMKLILISPAEKQAVTKEQIEATTLNFISLFAGIKQQVSNE